LFAPLFSSVSPFWPICGVQRFPADFFRLSGLGSEQRSTMMRRGRPVGFQCLGASTNTPRPACVGSAIEQGIGWQVRYRGELNR